MSEDELISLIDGVLRDKDMTDIGTMLSGKNHCSRQSLSTPHLRSGRTKATVSKTKQ